VQGVESGVRFHGVFLCRPAAPNGTRWAADGDVETRSAVTAETQLVLIHQGP